MRWCTFARWPDWHSRRAPRSSRTAGSACPSPRRSDDGTFAILAVLARENPRLRVVRGESLPAGWVGKPWALAQGARAAGGTWLLFTDADTYRVPEACTSALAFARAKHADALTLGTYQELVEVPIGRGRRKAA